MILDAVTQLQDLAMDSILAEQGKESGTVISQRAWGMISGKMKTWIVNYRDLIDDGIHVVFLAHTRKNAGEESEDDEVNPDFGPRVMPSVASVLEAAVKLTGNTFIREQYKRTDDNKKIRQVDYCMRLGPHGFYDTKIRLPKGTYVPDILIDPTYDKLMQIIKGEFQPAVRKAIKRRK